MSHRPQMLATEVRKIVAPILRACPSECGIVTITEVDVSSDCNLITVHISALRQPDIALAYMNEHHKELRHALGALHLHRMPELRFSMDIRSEQGGRIDKILQEEAEKFQSKRSKNGK